MDYKSSESQVRKIFDWLYNENQNEISDWNQIPSWAVGLIEYRNGGKYWISNDGLQLEEVSNSRHINQRSIMTPVTNENEYVDRFIRWLVWHLPRRIIMWSAIRLMANATQGKYSATIVPDLTAMDALDRWEYPQFDGPNTL